jgi:hypothetical protein
MNPLLIEETSSKDKLKAIPLVMYRILPDSQLKLEVVKISYFFWTIIDLLVCLRISTIKINWKLIMAAQWIDTLAGWNYLNLIAVPILLSTVLISGYFIFLILKSGISVFLSIKEGEHLRNNRTFRSVVEFNQFCLIGISNIVWLVWTLELDKNITISNEIISLIMKDLISWTLMSFGVFLTIYSIWLFYLFDPLLQHLTMSPYKKGTKFELLNFSSTFLILLLHKFRSYENGYVDLVISAGVLAHICSFLTLFSDFYLDSKTQSIMMGSQFASSVLLIFIFTRTQTVQSIWSTFPQFLFFISFLIPIIVKICDQIGKYSQDVFFERSRKKILIEIVMYMNYYKQIAISKKYSTIRFNKEHSDEHFLKLITLIEHYFSIRNSDSISSSFQQSEIGIGQIKRMSLEQILHQDFLREFCLSILKEYLMVNSRDKEIRMIFIKLKMTLGENYNLVLTEICKLSKLKLSLFHYFQVFIFKQKIAYQWRKEESKSFNSNRFLNVFQYLNEVRQTKILKQMVVDILENYSRLTETLQQDQEDLLMVKELNEKYQKTKKKYLVQYRKTMNSNKIMQFHNKFCKLVIPENNSKREMLKLASVEIDNDFLDSKYSTFFLVDLSKYNLGNVLYADDKVKSILGMHPITSIGRPVKFLLPEEIKENYLNYLQIFLKSGTSELINKKLDSFLIDQQGFIVPIRLYVKNYFISKNSSPCLIVFLQLKEIDNDYLFCNQYGKILNGTEDFLRLIGYKSNENNDQMIVTKLIPTFREIFAKKDYQNGSNFRFQLDLENIKRSWSFVEMIVDRGFSKSHFHKINNNLANGQRRLSERRNSDTAKQLLGQEFINKNLQIIKFRLNFTLEILETSLGSYCLFTISSIMPVRELNIELKKPLLSIFRIVLLKFFLRKLLNLPTYQILSEILIFSQDKKIISRYNNYAKRISKKPINVLKTNKMQKSVSKVSKYRSLDSVNINNIIFKKLLLVKLFMMVIIVFGGSIFTLIILKKYNTTVARFASLSNSFNVNEKRNAVFTSITIIPQLFTYTSLLDRVNVKDTLTITVPKSTLQLSIFSTFQKQYLSQKLKEVNKFDQATNSTAQLVHQTHFEPFNPNTGMNIVSNMYDMFVYLNFVLNKPVISYTDYLIFSTNAYKLSEEFGLDFERQVYIASLQNQILENYYYTYVSIGIVIGLAALLQYFYNRNVGKIIKCYKYSKLISISAIKAEKVQNFLKEYNINYSVNILTKEKENPKSCKNKNKNKTYMLLVWRGFKVLIPMIIILTVPLYVQVVADGSAKEAQIRETEVIINNLLNIDFLVSKALISMEDNKYPRRTYIRIFRDKFLKFFGAVYGSKEDISTSMFLFKTDSDLCPLLVSLNFKDCSAIYKGILTKGYKTLTHVILNEITSFFTNATSFYQVRNQSEFYQLIISFIFITRTISDECKLTTLAAFTDYSYTYFTTTLRNGAILLIGSLIFSYFYISSLKRTWKSTLSLLLHIKSREISLHSELLNIFK